MAKKKENRFCDLIEGLGITSLMVGNFSIFALIVFIGLSCKSLCVNILFGFLMLCSLFTTTIIVKMWWET